MGRFGTSLALAGMLAAFAPEAWGASILPGFQERNVLAEAAAFTASGSSLQSHEDSAPGTGTFSGNQSATAAIGGVAGSSAASQHSTIAASGLAGSGATSAAGSATGTHPFGSSLAESFFELFFSVDAPLPFQLAGQIQAAVSAVGDGLASIELLEEAGDVPIFSKEVAQGGVEGFLATGTLLPGATYRLTVLARAVALTDGLAPVASGSGGWSFALSAVPEPGSALLLGTGLLGCAVASRRRRTGSDRTGGLA